MKVQHGELPLEGTENIDYFNCLPWKEYSYFTATKLPIEAEHMCKLISDDITPRSVTGNYEATCKFVHSILATLTCVRSNF